MVMFTGLVDAIGEVRAIERGAKEVSFHVRSGYSELQLGESIAVMGTCLTVTRIDGDSFWVDASRETLALTNLGELAKGDRVHLERALRLGQRLGGHLVSGHIDGVGRLVAREPMGDAARVTFEVPERLAPFVAPKGSVAIDGVSLTINGVRGAGFDVMLVPYTRKETLFDARAVGARVNLEVDVLSKYVARLLGRPGVDGRGDAQILELLQKQGFLDSPAERT